MLKFISWNVNGLRACYDKGFADAFNRLEADFFCLQETKMQEGQLDVQFEGYQSYWNYAERKGYSGTAIFSKVKPLSVTYGLGIEEHDHEGRVITLELESYYLITVYTPNSQEELRRLDYRMKWDDDFRAYLKKLEEKKPVIVSMGDYAASGGYYISCAANRIFADPTTLTGSIGIFGMMYSGEKLFTETLGLNFDVVKTNKMADLGASLGPVLTRPLNASEQELMQNYVNRGYKLFVNRCAEGRKMSTEAIEKVAEGRVWTGAMAKDLGLVDELGGIDKALNAAATQAGIENYSIIGYPEKENIFASLLGNQKKHYINSEIKEYLGSYYNSFKALENIKNANCIQARMPFDPNIQ